MEAGKLGMVAAVRKMRVPFEKGPELVALRCTVIDENSAESYLWAPVECPVDVGDMIRSASCVLFWTPGSQAVVDVPYIAADACQTTTGPKACRKRCEDAAAARRTSGKLPSGAR